MLYRKSLAFAGFGMTLAAAAPLILHGHASPDCNPGVTLCAVSDALYLPDDPAPESPPQLIIAPAKVTSSVRSTVHLMAENLTTGRPGFDAPELSGPQS
jgi:hypothetical protein